MKFLHTSIDTEAHLHEIDIASKVETHKPMLYCSQAILGMHHETVQRKIWRLRYDDDDDDDDDNDHDYYYHDDDGDDDDDDARH